MARLVFLGLVWIVDPNFYSALLCSSDWLQIFKPTSNSKSLFHPSHRALIQMKAIDWISLTLSLTHVFSRSDYILNHGIKSLIELPQHPKRKVGENCINRHIGGGTYQWDSGGESKSWEQLLLGPEQLQFCHYTTDEPEVNVMIQVRVYHCRCEIWDVSFSLGPSTNK